MRRKLTPLQTAIASHVSVRPWAQYAVLSSQLEPSFCQPEQASCSWDKDYGLAVDLLCLYGIVRCEDHPEVGRILLAPNHYYTPPQASASRSFLRPQALTVSMMAATLMSVSCSMLPSAGTSQPLPKYQATDWFTQYRIEQMWEGGTLVYRFCKGDECPKPTPKVLAKPAQNTYQVASLQPMVPASLAAEDSAATTAPGTQEKPASSITSSALASSTITAPTSSATPTSIAPSTPDATTNPSSADKQPHAGENHTASTSSNAILGAGLEKSTGRLKLDTAFDSYKGFVEFANGSMEMDGLGKDQIAQMAPSARQAERVRLSGRVAAKQMTEGLRKLAIGRAYAVKVEFIKHDVDKDKLRILDPQQSYGDIATGTVRGVDIVLDMPKK